MKYMLDTNICIYLIKKKPVEVIKRLQKTAIIDICISSITLSELEYGVQKSAQKSQNRMALAEFIVPFEVEPFDIDAAVQYGTIRAELEKKGKLIGAMDMLIAAHALSLNQILVTNNIGEFQRVDKLQLENWAG
jgi:tRNA(fMet)-specific endonuclease VapC